MFELTRLAELWQADFSNEGEKRMKYYSKEMKPIRIWDFCLFVPLHKYRKVKSCMFCIVALLSAPVPARDLNIPQSTAFEHRVLTHSPQLLAQLLKSKESCLFLVVGVLPSLVALGFAAMLHGGSRRKMLTASRISLWDSVNNKCLVVTHKQLLPSSMPKGTEGWKDEG